MPTYDWLCPKCETSFSEIKSMHGYSTDPTSHCSNCDHVCGPDDRDFSKIKIQVSGAQVQDAEFNYGLGCVTKNKYDRSEIAKRKGVVEVGNDFSSGEKMQKEFENKRAEEREKSWSDLKDF